MCISVEVSNMKTSGNVEHLNTFSVRWFLTFYLPLCGKRIYLYRLMHINYMPCNKERLNGFQRIEITE